VHLVKEHHCCPNFLAQPIRREKNSAQPQNWPSMSTTVSIINGQTDRLASPYSKCPLDSDSVFSRFEAFPEQNQQEGRRTSNSLGSSGLQSSVSCLFLDFQRCRECAKPTNNAGNWSASVASKKQDRRLVQSPKK
jgi:hypothetical protein